MVNIILPQNEKTNKLLQAALIYATKFGFQVLPLHSIRNGKCTCGYIKCNSPGKHPVTRNGVKDSTSDVNEIRTLWAKYPFSNVGIRTGKESGIWVLDVDTKGTDGRETLTELERAYGKLPETVTAITGSQGLHYFFQYEEGIGNKVGFAPSLDSRGDNGFIVAAPSLHLSGRRYEYELSSHIMDVPIAKAPQWLTGMIITPLLVVGEHPKAKPSSHWQGIMNGVSEGGRNAAAASLAGYLIRKVEPLLAYEIMHLWNAERNDPPLSVEELDKVIDSIAATEMRRGGRR
ncbi:bifunctional DNA primase/polymerase [Sporosarcina jeotgali]|uniref:Bifunctional DNA primase/polymerase n=1 Tax=Sporosarcina jeotgali TaxID=3020056 RepID=A0ABZ0KVC6_9BACL|nr:bifunctional DNA primase/polymerase [Sporosarcina sp. B2O-1]WOV83915.1 bifunctional DNA primase/polymerase [Sporosarcina sp. B2O-1]